MKAFFDVIRKHFGSLNQGQVEWFNRLMDATNGLPDRHTAYVLATAWHEMGRFKYDHEIWGPTAQQKKYEPPHPKAKELGNTMKGDGYKFRGRGPSQLTGRANYVKASKKVGVDLVATPELAAKPEYGSKILVSGMKEGWFTGKKMADFESFEGMRRVVNGTDRAADIAKIANKMLEAVRVAQIKPVAAVEPSPTPTTPKTDLPRPASNGGFWAWLLSLFNRA